MNYESLPIERPPISSNPPREEQIVNVVQETKGIAMETLQMLNDTLYTMTAKDVEKTDIPETKCLMHDVAITRKIVMDIAARVRELKAVIGC